MSKQVKYLRPQNPFVSMSLYNRLVLNQLLHVFQKKCSNPNNLKICYIHVGDKIRYAGDRFEMLVTGLTETV